MLDWLVLKFSSRIFLEFNVNCSVNLNFIFLITWILFLLYSWERETVIHADSGVSGPTGSGLERGKLQFPMWVEIKKRKEKNLIYRDNVNNFLNLPFTLNVGLQYGFIYF